MDKVKLRGRIRAILKDAKTGKVVFISKWNNNLIPTEGLVAIANRLGNIGAKANEGIITYGAVGTGSSTPLITDTQMLAENTRKALTTTSVNGSVLTTETFFASGEANASLTQFALFGEDASASADSGTMFQYANFAGTIVKTSNETLTVESEITIA